MALKFNELQIDYEIWEQCHVCLVNHRKFLFQLLISEQPCVLFLISSQHPLEIKTGFKLKRLLKTPLLFSAVMWVNAVFAFGSVVCLCVHEGLASKIIYATFKGLYNLG